AQEADAAVELEAVLSDALAVTLGLPLGCSHGLAQKLIKVLRVRHGGADLYIPSAPRAERNAIIRQELRTGNAGQLAARFGISVSAVYKIAGRRQSSR